jgi:hypothetical protein
VTLEGLACLLCNHGRRHLPRGQLEKEGGVPWHRLKVDEGVWLLGDRLGDAKVQSHTGFVKRAHSVAALAAEEVSSKAHKDSIKRLAVGIV